MPARNKTFLNALLIAACVSSFSLRATESTNNATPVARIPLELRHGAALVRARANGSQTLTFKLDTGFGVTTIHPELVESLGLKRAGSLTITGIAGQEKAAWFSGATFEIGDFTYSPRRVAMIPSDAQPRRRGHDGILGAGFFRRFVVELDPTERTMTLHDPEQFHYAGHGEIIPLQFRRDTPTVEATIRLPGREPLRARYEIDSGCDGGLCLGHAFVKTNRLDELPGRNHTGSRTGVGGSVETNVVRLPQFQLGSQKLTHVAANFFREGSPVDADLAGHIGLGVLRHFKVIFDYSRRQMILEPLK